MNKYPQPNAFVQEQINKLLTTKHLYQAMPLEVAQPDGSDEAQILHRSFTVAVFYRPWVRETIDYVRELKITLSRVSLFCNKCLRDMPFQPTWFEELSQRCEEKGSGNAKVLIWDQTFSFTYICTGCDNKTSFLVKRTDRKISIHGRSPMEYVAAPKEIPAEVAGFYRGAVVAHQSGQTLAGLFLLRTLLEQYARKMPKAPEVKNAGDLMTWYMTLLPDDFKERNYSMALLYGELSEKIHAAVPDADLFERAAKEIGVHFQALPFWKVDPKAEAAKLTAI